MLTNTPASDSQVSVDLTEFDDFDALDNPVATPAQASAPTGQSIFNTPDDKVDEMLAPETTNQPATPAPKTAEERAADEAAKQALLDLDNELAPEQEDGTDAKPAVGRPKVDKSGLHDVVSKLIEKGTLFEFEAEEGKEPKPLADYTPAELQELIELNISTQLQAEREKTPKEFFDALPEELQFAAKYVQDGGQDLRGLFQALGQVEESRALDVSKPVDQEHIVRQYLQATKFGSADDIEEQIADYKAAGTLAKWAGKHKPTLDAMSEEQVKVRLQQQEAAKQRNIEVRENYLKNVHSALKDGQLGGQKIDRKTQEKLWNDLTQTNYQLSNGRPTNKLGYLLEQKQFGENPDYQLIAQATWLLEDPVGYHKHFAQAEVNKNAQQTARTLKTEQGRKVTTSAPAGTNDEPEKPIQRKTIARPKNIFGR